MGKVAGENFLTSIKNGTIACRKDAQGKIIDTLDIVAHSMGYAYSLGICDVLKGKIKFGKFYVLAPENACSGSINLGDYEEVWQYGANENFTKGGDPPWIQDGVAPQCPINGIDALGDKGGRVYIPSNVEKGFIESHSISNYTWIFDKTKKQDGYVSPRK